MNPVIKKVAAMVPEEKKKGTATLVVSIAVAAILLPLIFLLGIFSVLGTKSTMPTGSFSLTSEQIYQMERMEDIADSVMETFKKRGLDEEDMKLASFLSFTLLENEKKNEDFYEKLADAFEMEGDPAENVYILFNITKSGA